MKKDTLKLQKYEENLLLYYRKFLQKLEKYSTILRKKHGNGRVKTDVSTICKNVIFVCNANYDMFR